MLRQQLQHSFRFAPTYYLTECQLLGFVLMIEHLKLHHIHKQR